MQAFNDNQKKTRNSVAALYSLDRIDDLGEPVPESWDAQAFDALEGHMAQRSPYKTAGLGRGDVKIPCGFVCAVQVSSSLHGPLWISMPPAYLLCCLPGSGCPLNGHWLRGSGTMTGGVRRCGHGR